MNVSKPRCSARRVYVAGRIPEKLYVPVAVDWVVSTTFVALFVRVILTPGTAAPVGSETVPVTPPVSTCAERQTGRNIATANQRTNTIVLLKRRIRFIRGPPEIL